MSAGGLAADIDHALLLTQLKTAVLLDQRAQVRAAVAARIEVRVRGQQALPDGAESFPSAVVRLADRVGDQLHGPARRILPPRRRRRCRALPLLRRGFKQVFDIDEPVACIPEGLGRLPLAKAADRHPLLTQALRQPREVTVRRNEAEAVEAALMQQVHGVDDEGDVRRVLAPGVAALLVLKDSQAT